MLQAPWLVLAAFIVCVAPVSISHAEQEELGALSRIGKGGYVPLRLKRFDGKRTETFDTSFEECAPGRNSAANEWSAFGAPSGNMDFNAMGRNLRVRYPIFDLVFRVYDGDAEIKPDTLDSFRLGLVENRYPAIWGGWQYDGLVYRVSVRTVPSDEHGNYDLYKLEVQNPTAQAVSSKLAVGFDGPPDMRVEDGVVRGLGDAPFAIVGQPCEQQLIYRDWGLCDKRASAHTIGTGHWQADPAVGHQRVGLDGLPVVYRVKAEPVKRYVVYLACTPDLPGYHLEEPKASGDLVYEYRVEGCEPKTLDHIEYLRKNLPPCIGFEGAHDTDGDGYIEIAAGVTETSRCRHTRLGVIYVFPDGTEVDSLESVYSGAMNDQCVWHINVGVTPEQWWNNQHYDKSDVGFARLKLDYGERIQPGEIKTYWLKVPPIHRRDAVSMNYIGHAFREVLPGEAIPPYKAGRLEALRAADPCTAERRFTKFWDAFFGQATQFELPDPILNDIFLSRLATRAILDVSISDEVSYNACSPFFYFDHAYRDMCYCIVALDMAGMHEATEKLLNVYCMDVADVPKGPLAFDGQPLQLGMLEDGLWQTRPGQYDTQGQNLWALVQHYKLSGDREWLEQKAYPYIKRGAMWIVNSRNKHMNEVGDPEDPRYGLIEPGGMEVLRFGEGMHMYYMNAFAILGLREAADAAESLGYEGDYKLFLSEWDDLKKSLHKSFEQTFKRTGLYEGHLWFGVEPEGVGMYGFWAHNALLWPCRAIEPHDPMLVATYMRLEKMGNAWGGGVHSEGKGGCWPYIGVDRAIGSILRGEPERTLDYFCALTDTAGGTLSWGEGYSGVISSGDQPHNWADHLWLLNFRHLFAMEDGGTLMVTPALFRRWHQGTKPTTVRGLATHFGDLDLTIQPEPEGGRIEYTLKISPKGDQDERKLERIVLYSRTADGRRVEAVRINGKPTGNFTNEAVIIPGPKRGRKMRITVDVAA
ncbi:MAG TPA: hypothetical protein HPP77_01555 [Candidatus Hydrogenedentes bacterium]|nr:hypothetical protein [Candidatus Hydrogenedentota bacterium]